MKKVHATATEMMEMCIWNCHMYMSFHTQISDTFSILPKNHIPQANRHAA